MVDGRHFENRFIATYVLAADHLISMKFDADANFNTNNYFEIRLVTKKNKI